MHLKTTNPTFKLSNFRKKWINLYPQRQEYDSTLLCLFYLDFEKQFYRKRN